MNNYKLTLPEIYSRDTAVKTLRAVALYDELISLVYAQEALNSLAHGSREGMPLDRSLWSFARLLRLDVRHESIRVASQADIIIVAADSSKPIPSHVVSWLNASLREKGSGAPVLVALDVEGHPHRQGKSALLSELGDVAARWGAPLICNTEFDEGLETGLILELAQRNSSFTGSGGDSEYERLLAISYSGGWGLNE